MLQGKLLSLTLQNGVVLTPGAKVPDAMNFAPKFPTGFLVMAIHWVDGVDHEPSGWEVLVAPSELVELNNQTDRPDMVRKAIEVALGLLSASSLPERQKVMVEATSNLDEEERKELIKILGLIEKGKAAIKDKPMHFEVLWLRPEAVLSYVRKLNLEEGFEQYLERIGQEASTRIKVVDEEEEEATETPQAAAQPSAQAPS